MNAEVQTEARRLLGIIDEEGHGLDADEIEFVGDLIDHPRKVLYSYHISRIRALYQRSVVDFVPRDDDFEEVD